MLYTGTQSAAGVQSLMQHPLRALLFNLPARNHVGEGCVAACALGAEGGGGQGGGAVGGADTTI